MIFVIKYGDCIYFNNQQTRNFLKCLDELYQVQKREPSHWISKHKFLKNKDKPWLHKYLQFAALFNFVRIRTATFVLDKGSHDVSIRHYKYKVRNMENCRKFRNAIIDNLTEEGRMTKINCRNLKIEKQGDN